MIERETRERKSVGERGEGERESGRGEGEMILLFCQLENCRDEEVHNAELMYINIKQFF